ncbi:uncharacterized protein LOC118461722 isoform X1 [Anopheles albimanus]|uniref:uncharacterized protein LOC118461722 isoform X1 n=1 Tax=Anopheles albimanus TaxID=7167 RepID=UPI00163F6B75|nr:uncharacterized protein LOC118461722 isoform X1 [Anopheles albimanus]
MGKGKGGGSGGGGGGGQGGELQVAGAKAPKVEMTLKVVLSVAKPEPVTREERRVVKSEASAVGTFNPFPGHHPTPTAFRKR